MRKPRSGSRRVRLQKIHQTAVAEPDKLAVVFNGSPITYGEFWRLIEGCQRSLRPLLLAHGIAVLVVDSLLGDWVLSLALRGLGLDVAVTRTDEQVELFAGQDVACVITLASEGRRVAAAPAGARLLRVQAPSREPVSAADPLAPLPEGLKAGGQILWAGGLISRPRSAGRSPSDSRKRPGGRRGSAARVSAACGPGSSFRS